MPETAAYSTVCAVQNLWLAARAEGIGVGWLSILDPARPRTLFHIPDHILLVAYLCLGFVDQFATGPELERSGWEKAGARADCRLPRRLQRGQRLVRARAIMVLETSSHVRQIPADGCALPQSSRKKAIA